MSIKTAPSVMNARTASPSLRNHKIENCGLVCALLVASIHVCLSDSPHKLGWWMQQCLANGVSQIAVPYFFSVSGYLIARKYLSDENVWHVWLVELKKRVKTLLLPFWIWSLLFFAFLVPIMLLADYVAGRSLESFEWMSYVARTTGMDFMHDPVLVPLWYLRTLFILVLISPLLVLLIRKVGVLVPICVYAGYCGLEVFGIKLPSVFYDGRGLAYFTIGLYLSICNFKFSWCLSSVARFVFVIFGVLSILALVICRWFDCPFAILPFVVPGILLLTWHLCPSAEWPSAITSLTFPIYILHCFVLLPIACVDELTAWMSRGWDFIFRWIVAVLGSAIIAIILHRLFPRFSKIAFGAR